WPPSPRWWRWPSAWRPPTASPGYRCPARGWCSWPASAAARCRQSRACTPLVLASPSFALPLLIWLLAGFIREIPIEVEEAAFLDGPGRVRTLRSVVLPLIAPGVASAALLTFLAAWNEFLFAYTFTATGG